MSGYSTCGPRRDGRRTRLALSPVDGAGSQEAQADGEGESQKRARARPSEEGGWRGEGLAPTRWLRWLHTDRTYVQLLRFFLSEGQ